MENKLMVAKGESWGMGSQRDGHDPVTEQEHLFNSILWQPCRVDTKTTPHFTDEEAEAQWE